ncbi:MAG: hypothetical protein HDT11_00685 [Helicobacter sp.]|nr:hypothetical protein [Helicobacter sp.]
MENNHLIILVFLLVEIQDWLLSILPILSTKQKLQLLWAALLSAQLATSLPKEVVAEPQVFPLIVQLI